MSGYIVTWKLVGIGDECRLRESRIWVSKASIEEELLQVALKFRKLSRGLSVRLTEVRRAN